MTFSTEHCQPSPQPRTRAAIAQHTDPRTSVDPRSDDCPHCGCADMPRYAEECPICPACGVVLDDEAPEPLSWLAQFPAPRRSTLANLFYTVIRRGETVPAAVVEQVVADIHLRLQWSTDFDQRQWWCQVLNILGDDPKAAQSYAGEVLAIEQLPAAEKARRKEDKAKPFIVASMRGKEITDKQRTLIQAKGWTGAVPTDRAEASALIDRLLRPGGTL
jgi:hypothetical protein